MGDLQISTIRCYWDYLKKTMAIDYFHRLSNYQTATSYLNLFELVILLRLRFFSCKNKRKIS